MCSCGAVAHIREVEMRSLGVLLAGIACLGLSAQQAMSEDLIIAVQKNPDVVEPMRDFSNVGMRVVYNIAETLIERDFKDGQKLVPGLATAWTRIDDRTIDSHIKRLRRKFKAVDDNFSAIETLYGLGYRFQDGTANATA